MKIILVVAVSCDGFIAKHGDKYPYSWFSDEDQKFFRSILEKHKLFVMGKNTYDTAKAQPTTGKLKIVLTSKPADYSDEQVPGLLEFCSMNAKEFVRKYGKLYESCVLLGGSYLYREFLEQGLVDETYMTVEPVTLNNGVPFLRNGKKLEDLVEPLPKPELEELNDKGTILKHYILK